MQNSVLQRLSLSPLPQALAIPSFPLSSEDSGLPRSYSTEGLEADLQTDEPLNPLEAIYQELRCARLLNLTAGPLLLEVPEEVAGQAFQASLETLADAIRELTTTATCCILLQEAGQSSYRVVYPFYSGNEEHSYTRLTPEAMTALVGSERFISSFLTRVNPAQMIETELLGFVLVADKTDNSVFTAQDQAQLERVAHYLTPPLLGLVQACKQYALLRAVRAMAVQDELTGLSNRRGFYEQFEREIERARRNPSSLCVAIIDVDHFKRLNDEKGHLNGDKALQQLARILQANVRRNDWVCRFGGEEFVMLFPDTPLHSAADLVDRIADKIRETLFQGLDPAEHFHMTISAGVVQAGVERLSIPPPDVIHKALIRADEKLYQAKEHGRNRVFS